MLSYSDHISRVNPDLPILLLTDYGVYVPRGTLSESLKAGSPLELTNRVAAMLAGSSTSARYPNPVRHALRNQRIHNATPKRRTMFYFDALARKCVAGLLNGFCRTYAAFFWAAQRRLTASAMRLRPSGLILLFFLADFTTAVVAFGLPGPRLTPVPSLSKARACVNLAISWSISARIPVSPIVPPLVLIVIHPSIQDYGNKHEWSKGKDLLNAFDLNEG